MENFQKIFWIRVLENTIPGSEIYFLAFILHDFVQNRFKQFEKPDTKTIPIVLAFQTFVSFIKINSKKHVIMKNFDNGKITKIPCLI